MSEVVQQKDGPGFDLVTWFEVNKRAVVWGLGAVVITIAGTIIWKGQQQAHVEASSGALLAVTTANKQAPPVAELDKVAQAHAGTAAAAQAALLAGKELFQQGKFAEARSRFEAVRADSASDDVLAAAKFGLAACFDAEGKLAEALSAYQQVADSPGGKHLSGLVRLTMARIQESQGKAREALALYDAILRTPGSGSAQEASQLRTSLLRQHPDLTPAVTNAPAAAVPPTP